MFVQCRYCHKSVLRLWYPIHQLKHTKLLGDGQMTDHISCPPENRYKGSLDGVPRVYEHKGCGGVTGMPEEIIRSYLVDPYMYSDYSFCTGCGEYVHMNELFWVKTGESLLDYNRRLRQQKENDS